RSSSPSWSRRFAAVLAAGLVAGPLRAQLRGTHMSTWNNVPGGVSGHKTNKEEEHMDNSEKSANAAQAIRGLTKGEIETLNELNNKITIAASGGNPAAWACANPAAWACGSLAAWACGNLAAWACGALS